MGNEERGLVDSPLRRIGVWSCSLRTVAKPHKMNKLDELAFQLRFSSKQLERMSKRCEKEEREEKVKIKKALEKGESRFAENQLCCKGTAAMNSSPPT